MHIKRYLALLFFLEVAVVSAISCMQISASQRDLQKDISNLNANVSALREEQQELELKLEAKPMALKPEGQAFLLDPDIPLDAEIQEYVYIISAEYDVQAKLILAIIEHESGYIWHEPKTDANGLESVGYMQINYPHWQRLLDDYGVDVTTHKGNIEGGVIILAELLDKYPLEKALICYQCGEAGAKGIESTEFSRWVLGKL